MRYRFGKYRVSDCKCELMFTCGPCLEAAVVRNIADDNMRAVPIHNHHLRKHVRLNAEGKK